MDLEIKASRRWRKLATSPEYSYPHQKVIFYPKTGHYNVRAQYTYSRPGSAAKEKNASAANDVLPGAGRKKDMYSKLLDEAIEGQRKDIDILYKGYLNPNVANARLHLHQERTATSPSASPPYNTAVPSGAASPKKSATRKSIDVRKEELLSQFKGEKPSSPNKKGLNATFAEVDEKEPLLFDIMAEYDGVKKQLQKNQESKSQEDAPSRPFTVDSFATTKVFTESRQKTPATAYSEKQPMPYRTVMPQLALQSRTDRYQTLKAMNAEMVSYPLNTRTRDKEKVAKLEEVYDYLQKELAELKPTEAGYHKKRLYVYGTVFEKIITDFKVLGPILSEIKLEYDKIVSGLNTDEEELESLRSKVRKLLAQNENRTQLQFEKKRGRKLQQELQTIQAENEELRQDYRRKLNILARYLPDAVLKNEMEKDPCKSFYSLFILVLDVTQDYNEMDPIEKLESKIKYLETQLDKRNDSYDNLKRLQEEDSVPKALKDQLEYALKDAEMKIKGLEEQNMKMDQEINEKSTRLIHLEESLKEKEDQYAYLIAEYNKLTHQKEGTTTEAKVN